VDSVFGDIYVRAVELVAESPTRAQLALLGHCVRELVNRLSDVLAEQLGKPQFPPHAPINEAVASLRARWEAELPLDWPTTEPAAASLLVGEAAPVETAEPVPYVQVPRSVFDAAQRVVVESRNASANATDRLAVVVAEAVDETSHVAIGVFRTRRRALTKWAHLDNEEGRELPSHEQTLADFEVLEDALHARLSRFFETAPLVRQLQAEANRLVVDPDVSP
jgi:hypothetical protein